MTPEELEKIAAKEEQARAHIPHTIDVCLGTTCMALQSDKLKTALEQEATRHPVGSKCQVRGVGCPGLCALGPLVTVKPEGDLYKQVKPEDAHDIVNSLGAEPVARLKCDTEQPFFKRQHKIVLENSGSIDPERLEDYIAAGGYTALHGLEPDVLVAGKAIAGQIPPQPTPGEEPAAPAAAPASGKATGRRYRRAL